ncbi:hypothetical protein, partial [Enterococcus faecium]|uniref:hypothetical protein n=1 Tax=Enterococcus faecium TaxID=1352 RepID=UPI0011E7436E
MTVAAESPDKKAAGDQWLEDWRDHLIHWFVPGNTAQQMIFHLHDFQAAMLPSTVWYPRYDRI